MSPARRFPPRGQHTRLIELLIAERCSFDEIRAATGMKIMELRKIISDREVRELRNHKQTMQVDSK